MSLPGISEAVLSPGRALPLGIRCANGMPPSDGDLAEGGQTRSQSSSVAAYSSERCSAEGDRRTDPPDHTRSRGLGSPAAVIGHFGQRLEMQRHESVHVFIRAHKDQ